MNDRLLLWLVVASVAAFAGCESKPQPGKAQPTPTVQSRATPQATATPALKPQTTPATRVEVPLTTGPKPWMAGTEQGLKPTLFVANFATDSDDKLPWGAVFSEILTQKLNYAPHELFSIPPGRFTHTEFRHTHHGAPITESYPLSDALRIARIFALAHVLTGQMEKRGETLRLNAQLLDTRTSQVVTRFSLEGTIAQAPTMMIECCNRVFSGLGMKPNYSVREYISKPAPATGEILRRAAALMAKEMTDKIAAEAWKELCAADPTFDFAKVMAVNSLLSFAPDQAIAEAKRFHTANPDQGRLWELYIGMLCEADHYAEAVPECEGFLRVNPNHLTVMVRLADAYRDVKRFQDALAVVERVVQLAPDNWWAHYARGFCADKYGWYKRGNDYWANVPFEGKIIFPRMMDLTRKEYERALQINPGCPDMLARLAGNYIQTGESEATIESFCRKALSIESDNWQAYTTLLWYYQPGYSDQPDKAMALCREAAERNPKSAEMQWLMTDHLMGRVQREGGDERGMVLLKKPEIVQAIEQSIEKTFALAPDQLDWRVESAIYFYWKNDFPTAWKHLSQVGDYIPRRYREPDQIHKWWTLLARTAWRTERWDDAIPAAEKGLASNPCKVCRENLLMVISLALQQHQRPDEALKYLEDLAQTGVAFNGWACEQFAFIIFERQPARMTEGFEYAKKAVALMPDNPERRLILARYHWKRRERQEALKEIEAALAVNPNHGTSLAFKNEILNTRR